MSDGSNGFGEALEDLTANTKQAIGGTIADFTKSVAGQVKGSGGISGSFTPPKQQPQNGSFNPDSIGANTLQGGDLFSPDAAGGKQKQQGQGQAPQMLTKAGQQLVADPGSKSPEDIEKIQKIEQELRSLHQEYYQDFLAKAEGRDRKTVVENNEKEQDKQEEKFQDMQKKEEKKQQDDNLLKAQRATENKGGGIG